MIAVHVASLFAVVFLIALALAHGYRAGRRETARLEREIDETRAVRCDPGAGWERAFPRIAPHGRPDTP